MSTASDELRASLERFASHSMPPADVVADVLSAYAARVQELEDLIVHKDARIGEEVSFQRHIRESERDARNEQSRRHVEEKRRMVEKIGFAAVVHDRVISAERDGRKTVRLDALLAGRPEVAA